MGYDFGSITGDATPNATLYTKIETLLTLHAAWSFVETWNDGTYDYHIWRNSGAVNAWGQDFYIFFKLHTTSPTTPLYMGAMEVWDGTGKTASRYCVNPGYSVTPDATYRSTMGYAATQQLNHVSFNVNGASVNTTDFQYLILVTSNAVFFRTTAGGYLIFAGLYESFAHEWYYVTNNYEFPLAVYPIGYTDFDNAGSFSRAPNKSSSSSWTDAFATYLYFVSTFQWSTLDGTIPNGDVFYGEGEGSQGYAIGSRAAVRWSNSPGAYYRGLMYDLLFFNTDAAVDMGDTITIDGEVWAYAYTGIWINTQAA